MKFSRNLKENRPLVISSVENNIKIDLKGIGCELGSSGSGYGSCEHGFELRGSPFIGR